MNPLPEDDTCSLYPSFPDVMEQFSISHNSCISIMQKILQDTDNNNYNDCEQLCTMDKLALKSHMHTLDSINLMEATIPSLMHCMIKFFNAKFLSKHITNIDHFILKDNFEPFILQRIKPWLSAIDEPCISRAWQLAYYNFLFKLLDLR